jgi:uncharacterized protein (TIGR03435 family)
MKRAVVILALGVTVMGQGVFEVASIKRNVSGSTSWGFNPQPSGGLVATNVTPRQMVIYAYSMQNSRVEGGPDWIDTERYDIVAKGSTSATQDQMLLMLRALLNERFKAVVRIEPRETPVFALQLAREDRRLGPELRPSDVDCVAVRSALAPGAPPPVRNNRPLCTGRGKPGLVIAGAVTMEEMARNLTRLVDRPIIDRTGLHGRFDVDLRYTPDLQPVDPAGDAPALFVALQEQLGLKLQSQRAPIDVAIIQSIEHPVAD